LQLGILPLRFVFRAVDPIYFPPGKSTNIFRGAFGLIFRRIACDPRCGDASTCARARDCSYARMFEPRAHGSGPSGLQDQPRPFVLRAASLDGKRFSAGETFELTVNVFDPAVPALEYFRLTFVQLLREGLGPGRPRVELTDAAKMPDVSVDLLSGRQEIGKLRVDFLTPTELKSGGLVLREPRFDALFARARDRVSALLGLYQSVVPDVDFRGMGERARAVRPVQVNVREIEFERRSARTGQRHGMGGFVGSTEYEGELGEFVPWLDAAQWTGVGRLTVWGNGHIQTHLE
jgi:hypothetical protein